MASFKELLKEVENGNRTGFKNNAWFPHKSAEGGTRTLAYGHKLSDQEEKGNYVMLPDGSVVDFDNRGLTDKEAELLLNSDIQKHKKVAEVQWNASQKTDFSSLNPLHQSLLTEIAYNIGTLKNSKGKFGWPSLAKGILNNDNEVIKQELMRSFTDAKGNRKELTTRVNKIRNLVDEFETDPTTVTFEGIVDQPVAQASSASSGDDLVGQLMQSLEQMRGGQQRGSQTVLREGAGTVIREEEPQDEAMAELDALLEESLSGRERRIAGEKKLEQTYEQAIKEESPKKWSKKDEKAISEIDKLLAGDVIYVEQDAPTPPTQSEEQPVERERDDSKDPIFGIF